MNKRIIYSDKEYAKQDINLQSVPYGYIDKTICGCGLTTVAIESLEDIIIAMPTIALVTNKAEQYPNKNCKYKLLPVYMGITTSDIDNYIEYCRTHNQPIKIMITYDSISKVEEYLSFCRLIIDESDRILSLTKDKDRKENILKMLDIAEEHKDTVSFISSTPIDLKYMPEWISTIPYIRIEWEHTVKAVPILMKRGNTTLALRNEILMPLNEQGEVTIEGKTFSSVIVFLNSISQITRVIKQSNINKKDCRIICGNNLKNDIKIKGIKRYSVGDKFKYLFVTKSGFSGMDILSEDAMTIVVSNTRKDWQMVDIPTDLKQAVSRQRIKNNPNYGCYIYIYNQSLFDLTEEELLEKIEDKKDKILKGINIYELAKVTNNKRGFMTNADFNAYTVYDEESDSYKLNEPAFNADLYYLLETRRQYTKGFDIKGELGDSLKIIEHKKQRNPNTPTYRDIVEYFLKSKNKENIDWGKYSDKEDWIEVVESSYKLYGKVWKDYSYAKNMVNSYGNEWELIKTEIKNLFRKGNRYSRKEVTERLQKLYDKKGIDRTAKYSDIYEVFNRSKVKEIKVMGERCIEIL